jgi:hypothetical protein
LCSVDETRARSPHSWHLVASASMVSMVAFHKIASAQGNGILQWLTESSDRRISSPGDL